MKLNKYTLEFRKHFVKYLRFFAFYEKSINSLNDIIIDEIAYCGLEVDKEPKVPIIVKLPD